MPGGVVRLQLGTCDGEPSSMGSGCVLDDHLVMTAAHVVADAPTIIVRSEHGFTAARVVGYDYVTDSALIYTDMSFEGQAVALSDRLLARGRELAVFGYPLGVSELRVSTGVVSGLDESAQYDEFTVDQVFTTDAATNRGNSGGPVFDRLGKVIGLVSGGVNWTGAGDNLVPVQGVNYLVPSSSLIQQYNNWSARQPAEQDTCSGVEAPADDNHFLDVTVSSDHPDASDVAQAVFLHGQGINEGNYEAAWSVFGPSLQRQFPLATWQGGLGTSYWETLDLFEVTGQGDQLVARAQFRTEQDAAFGRDGQTCSDWLRDYTMIDIDGSWRIDATSGPDPTPC